MNNELTITITELALGFNICPVNAILPNPRTLDDYALRQDWSAIYKTIRTTIKY